MSTKPSPDPRTLLRSYLAAQCAAVLAAEPALRHAPEAQDPGGRVDEAGVVDLVHDTRVAVRRLRSTLRTFARAFAEPDRGVLIEEAGWFAERLGALRDLDVIGDRAAGALDRLPAMLALGDVRARLDADLTERRAAEQDAVAGVLSGDRWGRLRELLNRWRDEPVWSPDADRVRVRKRVRKAGRKVERRVRAAASAVTTGDPDAAHLLHQARKAGKRHRYAVELATPVLEGHADRVLAARKHLQDELGELQDSAVTVDYLVDLGRRLGNRSGHNAFTFGALAAAEHRRQHDQMAGFADRHG